MRGVSFLVAVTFAAEIGDVRRFDTPRQLMSFLGLVPAERSTGETVRRSGLTLAGNRRARRVLVEAAWSYRHPARVSETLRVRLEALPKRSATSPGRPRCGCAAAIDGSTPPARNDLSSSLRSPARWLRSCGRSAARSRQPRVPERPIRILAAQRWGWSNGGELPSLVMWPSIALDARPLDRGKPRDESTEGGNQPADKSLINRRLNAPSPTLRSSHLDLAAPHSWLDKLPRLRS